MIVAHDRVHRGNGNSLLSVFLGQTLFCALSNVAQRELRQKLERTKDGIVSYSLNSLDCD
jgi:hypothetical protein